MGLEINAELHGRFREPNFKDLFEQPLRGYAQEMARIGDEFLDRETPKDSGKLREGLTPKRKITANKTEIKWQAPASVGYGAALDKDKRRGAGRPPPVGNILRWIERRRIVPRQRAGRDKAGTQSKKQLAFAIANHIAKHGQTNSFRHVRSDKGNAQTKGWFRRFTGHMEGSEKKARSKLVSQVKLAWRALYG